MYQAQTQQDEHVSLIAACIAYLASTLIRALVVFLKQKEIKYTVPELICFWVRDISYPI